MGGETVKFADGQARVAGLALPAPLEAYGNFTLYEAVKSLDRVRLGDLARALGIEAPAAMPVDRVACRAGLELQLAWYREVGNTPATVLANYRELSDTYDRWLAQLEKGETIMAEKKARSKTPKTPKRADEPLQYRLLTSKVDGELGKKLEDETRKNHDVIILQVLQQLGEALIDKIVAAVKETKRYNTADDLTRSVHWHLKKLEAEGLVAVRSTV